MKNSWNTGCVFSASGKEKESRLRDKYELAEVRAETGIFKPIIVRVPCLYLCDSLARSKLQKVPDITIWG